MFPAIPEPLQPSEVNLCPWAAYVVGHHTLALYLDREFLMDSIQCGYESERSEFETKEKLDELNKALRVLVLARKLEPAVLVELRYELDRFARIWVQAANMAKKAPEELTAWQVLGCSCYQQMDVLGRGLFTQPDHLEEWRRLGSSIGAVQFMMVGIRDLFAIEQFPIQCDVRELARQLNSRGECAFLMPIAENAEKICAKLDERTWPKKSETLNSRYRDIFAMDLKIRSELEKRPMPEPLLILSAERLVFFGEERCLSDYPEGQMSCLWSLAERPRMLVQRKTIIEIGACSAENHLKPIVSKLRGVLKKLVDAACTRTGQRKPPEYQDGFIKGQRGRQHFLGPYMLDINPARVRIEGPRPAWMARAPSK